MNTARIPPSSTVPATLSVISLIASKSCCFIPSTLVVLGLSGSVMGLFLMTVLLPVVAAPALGWSHYRFWKKPHMRKSRLHQIVLTASTLFFIYSLVTHYIPHVLRIRTFGFAEACGL